ALLDLEQIRSVQPAFAMSARGGSLLQRVQRLLSPRRSASVSPAWLPALAGLALVSCLLVSLHPPARAGETVNALITRSVPMPIYAFPLKPAKPVLVAFAAQVAAQAPDTQPEPAHDFLTGIVAAGFRNLTVDELIDLKIHGVTPA